MLKSVFLGSRNDFDQVLVHWLAQRTTLVGVVWAQSTAWQRTWCGRLRFAKRRMHRYGLAKVFDETLFYLHYHSWLSRRDQTELYRRVINPYHAQHGIPTWAGDAIFATDVNAPEVLTFLEDRRPDVGFVVCMSDYFGKKLRSIPKHGMFLWHEGITPEYMGLYSPFWAVHNLDFDAIGCTLLLMNDSIDGGPIYVQGRVRDVDPLWHHHGFLGHKAIMNSLPAVERFLQSLEAGTARPITRAGAVAKSYTYPGLSDLVRQRLRLRRARRASRV